MKVLYFPYPFNYQLSLALKRLTASLKKENINKSEHDSYFDNCNYQEPQAPWRTDKYVMQAVKILGTSAIDIEDPGYKIIGTPKLDVAEIPNGSKWRISLCH